MEVSPYLRGAASKMLLQDDGLGHSLESKGDSISDDEHPEESVDELERTME